MEGLSRGAATPTCSPSARVSPRVWDAGGGHGKGVSLDLALRKPHAFLTGVTAAPETGFTPLPRGSEFIVLSGPLTINYRQNYLTLTSALLSVTGEAVRRQ